MESFQRTVISPFRRTVGHGRRPRAGQENEPIFNPNSEEDLAAFRDVVEPRPLLSQEQNIGTSLEMSPEEEAARFREVVARNLRHGQNGRPTLQELATAGLREADGRRGPLRREQNTGAGQAPNPEVATASQPIEAPDSGPYSDQFLEQARRRLRQLENELQNPVSSRAPNLEVATASQSAEASDARQIANRYLAQAGRRMRQIGNTRSSPEANLEVTTASRSVEISDARQLANRYLEQAERRMRQMHNTGLSPAPNPEVATASRSVEIANGLQIINRHLEQAGRGLMEMLDDASSQEPSSEVTTAAQSTEPPDGRRTPRESLALTNRETLHQLLERSRRRLNQLRNPMPILEPRSGVMTASQPVEALDHRPRLSESSEPLDEETLTQLLEPLPRRSSRSRNVEARLWAEAAMLESEIREIRRQTRSRPTYTGPWGFTLGSVLLHQTLIEETVQQRRDHHTNANQSHLNSTDEPRFPNAYRSPSTGGQLPGERRYHNTWPTLAQISEHIMRIFNNLGTDDRPAMVAWILTMAAEQVRTELAHEDELAGRQTN